jgi:hypothetical protein
MSEIGDNTFGDLERKSKQGGVYLTPEEAQRLFDEQLKIRQAKEAREQRDQGIDSGRTQVTASKENRK